MKTIKPSLRLTLTTILMSLLLLTMGSFGFMYYRNARYTADDLSTQILAQNSALIDSQVNEMLHVAVEQGRTNLRLLRSGTFRVDRFADLARYWVDVMEVHPRLSRLSLGLEATGERLYVDRVGGQLFVNELRRCDRTGKLGLSEFRPADYPANPRFSDPDKPANDSRLRPWYARAKAAGVPVWSETYMMIGPRETGDVPGITFTTPILAGDGSLVGALGATFDVVKLSTFLRGLKVGSTGFAFVVECRQDGSRRVIAHKDPKILVRPTTAVRADAPRGLELVPAEEMADRRVAAFLREVPPGLEPSRLKGTTRLGFEHDGVHYLGAYSCLSTKATPDWLICIVMPEGDVLARSYRSNRATFAIGVGILAVAMAISLYVSTQVARPLERIARETEAIGRIVLKPQPVAHSIVLEVDRLAVAVEQTKTSLRSFGKYVPADLIRQVFATGREPSLGGERRRMTISFCDLADFTSLAERLPPEELVVQMGDYFGGFSADIAAEGGTVDKYIGDAIMAMWGAPAPSDDHAASACLAALRNQETLGLLRSRWRVEGKPEMVARIGIMTGDAVVGNVGSPARFNYTAMGDPVNLASRLEGLGKFYGTRILIGDPTYREASHVVLARAVDRVSVKGKSEGLLIHELLARKDQATPNLFELAELAETALALYRTRDWERALAVFGEILHLRPGDGPATVLADRCRAFLETPPAEDWDGVHRMASK
jgi:adenylate cyclase